MSDKRQFLYFKDKIKIVINHVEFLLHTTLKIPSEKQNVYSSPDRADILFVFFFKKQKDKGDSGTSCQLKRGGVLQIIVEWIILD